MNFQKLLLVLFTLACWLTWSPTVQAQVCGSCTPDIAQAGDPFKFTPTPMPPAYYCVPYNQTVKFTFPYDTSTLGITCRFTKFVINSIVLPTGLQYNTNSPTNTFQPANSSVPATGCAVICGTPTQLMSPPDSALINVTVNTTGSFLCPASQNAQLKLGFLVLDTVISAVTSVSPTTICASGATPVTINFNVSGVLTTANVFTAQLSDANGSFANPTSIGTLTAGNTGCGQAKTISGSIQGGLPAGTGYKIRVVASQKSTITGYVESTNITIQTAPSGNITASGPTTFCSGGSVVLTAPVNPPYSWSLPGGATATTPTVTATASGNYTVTMGSGSCTGTATIAVTVNPKPVPSLGADKNVCTPQTLNPGNFPGATFVWTKDGAAFGTTPTVNATANGAYLVTVTQNNCTGTDDVKLTFFPLPVVNLGADKSVCAPITLDAGNNSPGNTFAWTRNGTNVGNSQTLNVTQSGNYVVSVTAPCGTTVTDDISVTVNSVPTVNLGADQAICGTTNISAPAGGTSYVWTKDGAPFATTQTITVSATGTYVVTVTGTGSCTATDDVFVAVSPALSVELGPEQNNVCGGVTLDAGNSFTGITYQWKLNGNNLATTQTIDATQTGNYSVTVTSPCGQVVTDNVNLTVTPAPTVNIGADANSCGPITRDAGTGGAT